MIYGYNYAYHDDEVGRWRKRNGVRGIPGLWGFLELRLGAWVDDGAAGG